MTMTEARRALSTSIRSLRARLLEDLHAATESAYRLSVREKDAGLDEPARDRRRRLAEWIAEQGRARAAGKNKSKGTRTSEDFRREAEKQAAYTLLNRLVLLRLMEAGDTPLRAPAVVTGGWESRGYQDFRQLAPGLVRGDETEGYAWLLQSVFEDLATELPGLYGPAGVAELVPVPAATLRHVIDALNAKELESCWTDDMTLGWVYQYWNDPEREALDAKLNSGGKVEPHEIASKTQMFTERYMVDWLLQNSLGPMWLAMCKKHGWTPEVEADGTLARLEARRADWRAKRDSGEVELTALMPLYSEAERRWAYYVPQPIPEDAVRKTPDSVRELELIDPAVGSGHFLVVALDLLLALYREEARHRGQAWADRDSVERILEHNLHGIDLDPRAVQIAAAALWLKARQISPEARPGRLNLVASNLRLSGLTDDDPALVELGREVERETEIPTQLTDSLVHALRGADSLGSLLKIDRAVEETLDTYERSLGRSYERVQTGLFDGKPNAQQAALVFEREQVRATLVERLETFLGKHTSGEDLGLRLRGEQLAAGVRFVRMLREGQYDLVAANPPYQGTSKMVDSGYVEKMYPLGKADLYAAFLLRGLELVREGGVSSMLTMRNWMFIKQYSGLREALLENHDLRALGDFAVGAFDEVPNDVLSVTVSVIHRAVHRSEPSIAQQPTGPRDVSYDRARTSRKRAATLCHLGRHEFDPAALRVVPEWPLVYWWSREYLQSYAKADKLKDAMASRVGIRTSNNARFIRRAWEVCLARVCLVRAESPQPAWTAVEYAPHVMGASGRAWFDDVIDIIKWKLKGFEVCVTLERAYGAYPQATEFYMLPLIALPKIGTNFTARATRYRSVFDNASPSVFPARIPEVLCLLNSERVDQFLAAVNPTVNLQPGDIDRIPLFEVGGALQIHQRVEAAFERHESHREPSVEFKHPGPSPWRHAQAWARLAVDRPENTPLPEYTEELDPEPASDHLSFALGVALGRFGPNKEGILDPAAASPTTTLAHGLLFLDTTLGADDHRDGLGAPAAARLHAAWAKHAAAIATKRSLRDWLAIDFFALHRSMYENRPIHWPLSSTNKLFVVWVNIHRFTEQTLRIVLADHLTPTLTRLEGELNDLRTARDGADKKAARMAEKQLVRLQSAKDELSAFIANVEQCADRGAPPTDKSCPERTQDARHAPDLDDGVMINSAALWPLLSPQWKEPKKWWKELATASGRKDYDWSHLAMRYWPTRVDEKCQTDPSLGVAHGCFWRYHPERAWAWELRLQDEIGPEFRIVEPPYRPGGRELEDGGDAPHRAAWLRDHAELALAAIEKEATRRMGRSKSRKLVAELRILEVGLWSAHAAELYAMEMRLSERQGSELRILAPDEAPARAAYEAAHPDEARARRSFMAGLVPPTEMFADDEEDVGEGPDSDSEDDT
jgi:hypothetical protein